MGGIYFFAYILGPPDLNNEQNTILYSEDGQAFGEEQGLESRHWIDLENMSTYLTEATILIEDQRFYKHKGLDVKRIIGAAIEDIKSKSLKEGASTLTQQYARNLYLSHEKTWTRKLKEAFYAIRIEMFYSKQDILEGYLNTIYYGHGAYGVEAASQFYFDKQASDLTLAEAAMIAGIPKGPSYYSPIKNIENATQRQHRILQVMLEKQVISKEQYTTAMNEELTYAQKDHSKKNDFGAYFQDTALNEAAKLLKLDIEAVRSGGLQIYTTLNLDQQKTLEAELHKNIDDSSDVEIGAIAMKPENGAIQALVGGRHYNKSTYNRAIQAKRPPGSAFKPFLYYAALENGYTPSTMMESKPTAFELSNGDTYQPGNYNGYYAEEPISLAQAIAVSDNVYAVKTHLYLGTDTLVETAKSFGINENLPAVASLALGTANVSVKDMVTGYGMIANGGKEIEGYTINKILDRNGKEVYSRPPQTTREKLNEQSTFILTHLLTGMFDEELNGYTTVTGAPIVDKLTHTYAGKSGTTNTDSWMIGFSPSLVTGIWLGYDDNRQMEKVAEVSAAKEIWADFMETSHGDKIERFKVPEGVIGVPVDPETGDRATPYCPTSRIMYYKPGQAPEQHCQSHFQENDESEEKGIFKKWFDVFMDPE